VANMISSNRDQDAIIAAVVRMTPLLVGVSWCGVLLWDEERQALFGVRAHGLSASTSALFEGHYFSPAEAPWLERARAGTEALSTLCADLRAMLPLALADSVGTDSLTALPLRAHARSLGVLLTGSQRECQATSDRRLSLLEGIAKQTSVALEAAQLYEQTVQQERLRREIELARSIQESFLPDRCPQIPGWQLVSEWRAARGVGGDYYDFIPLDAQHLGLVIADVADKGVAAALYMALTRTVMRASALETSSPAETLRRVNRLLMDDARSGMFVSMFYAILNLEDGRLIYARAGHNPPLLVRALEHTITPLIPAGIVLGIVADPELAEEELTLAPGDSLAMYTDGVIEAVNDGDEQFGEERLRELLATASGEAAESIVDKIAAAVRCFAGERPQFDDFTLMVLKRESA
jgi:phosphoserine phosphatase RsbU/P